MSLTTILVNQTINYWIISETHDERNVTNGNTMPGSTTLSPTNVEEFVCQWILYKEIPSTRVGIWDLMILVPNVMFVLFLIWNLKMTLLNLRQRNSPNITAFYILVVMVSVISVLRCIVAMTVNASVPMGDITGKALWLVLRFFLLATELSVVVFGLAFGHLDSNTSIRRVLLVTFLLALIYSTIQGTLEFTHRDNRFHAHEQNYAIFAHGGMIFWMSSSALFFVVYSVIYILPKTSLKEKLHLPSKKSFYYYALFLALLNCAQMIGSSSFYSGFLHGMCVVDITTYVYFSLFHPLVYFTFLRQIFRVPPQNIPFSYKIQVDEGQDDDIVNLPYEREDNNYKPNNVGDSGICDSTHLNRQSNS